MRANEIITINVDWAKAYGWCCPFCGGEIDHCHEEKDEEEGVTDDSYLCEDKGSSLCDSAYFMVRWSLVRRGEDGDALLLSRWIELEVDDRYVTHPDKDSADERRFTRQEEGD